MRSYVVWQDGFVVKTYITDGRKTVVLQLVPIHFFKPEIPLWSGSSGI